MFSWPGIRADHRFSQVPLSQITSKHFTGVSIVVVISGMQLTIA